MTAPRPTRRPPRTVKPPAGSAAAGPAVDGVPGRLLAAASEVFAEKGYDGATVRDVVARAGTNLNSINYHFGGKEQLYAAVMRYQAELAEKAHPRRAARAEPASPREALAVAVEDLLSWLLDPDSLLPALYARELVHPSSAFNLANVGSSQHQALQEAVKALLGPKAAADEIGRCVRSIYSQCAYFMFVRKVLPMIDPGFRYSARTVKALASHIVEFSLGGIEAIRRGAGRRA